MSEEILYAIFEVDRLLKEKDEEIERLKADLALVTENYSLSLDANQERREKIEAQGKLITEMADALGILTQLMLVSDLPVEVVNNKIRENQIFQERAKEVANE